MSSQRPRDATVRYAWIPLVLVTVVILFVVGSGEEGPVAEGSVLHAFASAPHFTDEAPASILEARLMGTQLMMMAVLGLAVILGPFRHGERWAWFALWCFPAFFVIHIIAFGTFVIDGIFTAICAASLLVPYRKFFPNRSAESELRTTMSRA
ncbi:MAG: hypothetical protein H0U65_03300 [Rubrobacter sp.]|nr:hypothetical protein [Rubrobacter sp.]